MEGKEKQATKIKLSYKERSSEIKGQRMTKKGNNHDGIQHPRGKNHEKIEKASTKDG